MERYIIKNYKGKKIYISNYCNMKGQEYADLIYENTKKSIEHSKAEGESILIITNVKDTYITREILEAFKNVAKDIKPYAKKSAVLGVEGIKKMFLNTVNMFSSLQTKAFDSEIEACEWLIEE